MIAIRSGPPAATHTGEVTVPGGRGTLAILVEAQGTGDQREVIARALANGIANAFAQRSGSATARLRAALASADEWLRARPDDDSSPGWVTGASTLVLSGSHAILAQAGPALAVTPGHEAPVRHPAGSPWLRGDTPQARTDPIWAPLGTGKAPSIHWSRWSMEPGTTVLLLATSAAALDQEAMTALLELPPQRAAEALRRLLPPDVPALYVHYPATRPWERAARAAPTTSRAVDGAAALSSFIAALSAGARAAWDGVSRTSVGLLAVARRQLRAVAVRVRPIAGQLVRFAARILWGLLPARALTESKDGKREPTRLAAIATVALPLAVLVLTLVMRSRFGTRADDVLPEEATIPMLTTEEDAAASVTRLADIIPVVDLPGSAGDERHIVGAPDALYVLNTTLNRVDRILDGVVQQVLAQGQTSGGEVVAELEDLFWLPSAEGSGRGRAVVLDSADVLWAIDGGDVAPLAIPGEPIWHGVSLAAGYAGNLYFLEQGNGQILRYESGGPDGRSFPSSGEPWLTVSEDLSQARDMAIDGAIYVLFGDGSMRKYEANQPQPFGVSNVPGGLTTPRDLYTSPTAGRLLVADRGRGRILVLAPDGTFQAQLLRPRQERATDAVTAAGRFPDLHAVWWDEAGGILYIVSGKVLYRAAYR